MNSPALPTKGERTRAHIVACAAALFWRRSFHGVSIDLIADTAEVNKATVYRYFADKRDLALAVVRHNGVVTLDTIFASVFAEYSEPEERLAAIYRHIYCAHRQMHRESGDVFGCPIVGLSLELGQEMPEVLDEASRMFDEVEQHFVAIAKQAANKTGTNADPNFTARTLSQLIHGANASSRLARDEGRILDAGRASLALIGFPDTVIIEQEKNA